MALSKADVEKKAEKRVEELEKELTSTVGKKAATLVALLAPLIAVACAWAQDKIGIDLDPEAVTGLISATVVGITGAGATWVYNRGNFEQRAEQLYGLYLQGREIEGKPNEQR
jgi:predicted N-acetyltransferase YhbS